jgi:hypothetical protein
MASKCAFPKAEESRKSEKDRSGESRYQAEEGVKSEIRDPKLERNPKSEF